MRRGGSLLSVVSADSADEHDVDGERSDDDDCVENLHQTRQS